MNPTTEQRLKEIQERAEKATPGKWYAHKQYLGEPKFAVFITAGKGLFTKELHAVVVNGGKNLCDVATSQQFEENEGLPWPAEENASFIAASRADIAWLLKLVRKQRDALDGISKDPPGATYIQIAKEALACNPEEAP